MKYRLIVQDTAKADVSEAMRYYNLKQSGLGKRFLADFRNKVKLVRSNPEAYAIRYKDIRMAMLKTFPYLIHFQLDKRDKVIAILAVFYGGEDPKKWLT
jgi:plasmid stabilization system protein ParE